MKVPIIIKENSNIFFFRTIQDAAEYLGSVDVEKHKHKIYNAEAIVLKEIPTKPTITIIELEGAEHRTDELQSVLKTYYEQLGLEKEWIEQATLAELVEYGTHEYVTKCA